MQRNKIKIKHPNPKLPPDPDKRIACLKEWKDKLDAIYKKNKPKTLEEGQALQPLIEKAEEEFDAKYEADYEVILAFDTTKLEYAIKKYGPLRIGIHNNEILAFTEQHYEKPKGLVKRAANRVYRYTRNKLQKYGRKISKG